MFVTLYIFFRIRQSFAFIVYVIMFYVHLYLEESLLPSQVRLVPDIACKLGQEGEKRYAIER